MARHGLRTEAEKKESSMKSSAAIKQAAKQAETQAETPQDPTNPAHYRSHASGVECIQIT